VSAERRGHLSERVSCRNGSFHLIVPVQMFLVFRFLVLFLSSWCCLFMGFLILSLLFMVFVFS
jgi:hypothetical protein